MIKLIVTDVDGTLVEDGATSINSRYIEVIKEIISKDIKFMVASGRQYSSINALFEPLKDDIIFTTMNGGYICYKDKEIFSADVSKENVLEIIEMVRNISGMEILISDENVDYTDSKSEHFRELLTTRYKGNVKFVENLLEIDYDKIKVKKVSLYSPTLDIIEESQLFRQKFENKLNVFVASEFWMDIISNQSSKGNGVKKIKELYNIKTDEVICFGDQENDLSMFDECGETFAMSGAIDELKKKAKHQLGSYEDNAVLEVLENILFELKNK